jgi:hypothetical protein
MSAYSDGQGWGRCRPPNAGQVGGNCDEALGFKACPNLLATNFPLYVLEWPSAANHIPSPCRRLSAHTLVPENSHLLLGRSRGSS